MAIHCDNETAGEFCEGQYHAVELVNMIEG